MSDTSTTKTNGAEGSRPHGTGSQLNQGVLAEVPMGGVESAHHAETPGNQGAAALRPGQPGEQPTVDSAHQAHPALATT